MPVWDEKPPVDLPGLVPQGGGGLSGALLQMLSAMKGGNPSLASPSGGGSAPGGPPQMTPTTTPSGMPIPGLTNMTKYQEGGPASRNSPIGPPMEQREWKTKAAANQASIHESMSKLQNLIVEQKQKSFEKESATANQAVTQIITGGMANDKVKRGEPLSQEELKAAATAMHMDPKILKLIEKAQKDPMSGAYVGIQNAYKAALQRETQRAEMEDKAAQAKERAAHAKYWDQAGNFQGERAQLERDKIQGKADLADEAQKQKAQIEGEKVAARAPYSQGMIAERNPDGSLKLNDKNQPQLRAMNDDDVKMNPELKIHYNAQKALITQRVASAQASQVRAKVAQMREERLKSESAAISEPGAISSWAKRLADPTSGITITAVPSKGRAAVMKYMDDNKMSMAKPLSNDEIKRMDLANNAIHNIEVAQDILKRRPDMFGPGGWGKSKFELALAGGDEDAIAYTAAAKLMNLPLVGIHGVRGKWAVEDLDKYDSNLYLNPESMGQFLATEHASADQFRTLGGRPKAIGGTDSTGGGKKPDISSFEKKKQ